MPRRRTHALTRALMQPIRAGLNKRIHASTGSVSLGDLADTSGLDLAIVRYHVKVLVACGLAEFPPGSVALAGGARDVQSGR
jgi:hypothetical protein